MTKRNIVHIEIPSANLEASGKFYEALFGWKITPMPEMNYTLWEPAEGPGGGFNPLGESTQPGDILIYVDSADIEADLKNTEAFGGRTIIPKSEIPGVGWFGIFTDPTGNRIALYTSKDPEFPK
jgi:predicted enzyme related to lactoylglutathione lyase